MAVSAGFSPEGYQKKPNPIEEMYGVYNQAVNRQGGDYNDIMGRFRNLYDNADANAANTFKPVSVERASYAKSPDTTAALANLRGLTETGGLSSGDQQNLRARGISPIRAQYATAQRDMNRQRRLGGATSANFGAVTSKLARDQSSLVADQMDKVNAGIAEMVQRGKLSVAPQYAGAAQAESELANKFSLANADAANQTNQFNARGLFDARMAGRGDKADAARGMTQLYGTTPALSSLYGDQAMKTASFQNDVNQNKKRQAGGFLAAATR